MRRSICGTTPMSSTAAGPSSQVLARSWSSDAWPRASGWAGPTTTTIWYLRNAVHTSEGSTSEGTGPIVCRVREQQSAELARTADAQLNIQVVGAAGEQLDEPGCGMLREQVRGGNSQQATTSSGLAHLEDGAVLQTDQLSRTAGKPKSD